MGAKMMTERVFELGHPLKQLRTIRPELDLATLKRVNQTLHTPSFGCIYGCLAAIDSTHPAVGDSLEVYAFPPRYVGEKNTL